MKSIDIDGIIPVIPTPFTKNEEIDEEALRQLVDFAAAANACCICLPAYGSEFYKLSEPERFRVVEIAVDQSNGRVPVLAQSNHGSAKIAAEFARKNEDLGADMISFALPRQFAVPEDDMLRYAERGCNAVKIPVLIQDFFPGGVTIGAAFCKELQDRCSNFHSIKLEEPVMGPKVREIREATGDTIAVLEGWGGLYMIELFTFGIRGLMPGTGACDVLDYVWRALVDGRRDDAFSTFEKVMPLISFSLQTWEIFHYVEKRLLQRRGALQNVYVRDAQWTPSREVISFTDELIDRVLDEAERIGLKKQLLSSNSYANGANGHSSRKVAVAGIA